MLKFSTFVVLVALLAPLFLLNTKMARAEDFPTVTEEKKKPKAKPTPTPTPTPRPKPKIGPRDGGADD